jgi:hypothetical protein
MWRGFDLAKNEPFIEQGGQWAESVQVLAQLVDVIIHSLQSAAVLVSTVDQLLEVAREGQVVPPPYSIGINAAVAAYGPPATYGVTVGIDF